MQQDPSNLARGLQEYMHRKGVTQVAIAKESGTNQPAVSRFLSRKKPPQRVTVTHNRLCNYALNVLSKNVAPQGKEVAKSAFEECWNRSEVHARAISKIIDAFVELCRTDQEDISS